jgi:hypothetical protein
VAKNQESGIRRQETIDMKKELRKKKKVAP